MIAYLKGRYSLLTPTYVHLETQGIGYEVFISLNTFESIRDKSEGQLFTYLHIREDAHILYGFATVAEKEMFLQLIGVNGVGASTARMMLSSLKPEEISRAILQGNSRQLESVKGIGRKTAERIVLELRDKLGQKATDINFSNAINNTVEQDALNALLALGIARPAAEQALRKAINQSPGSDKVEDLIKSALKNM
ncbi:Holliday junction branch migration protein RuvA [Flavihumibacter petaseus]|uniref:Holliday junction branch migration complex subunit RuvA n=1 Tax=Flavihumibacter petaseus NBRC 106054 TaxID=1220578 RepID=A0A0E9N6Y0_9BACT|nr:Holliday junction branch migration protein RuvA [Flavihumibacter petaseus]GAO45584.1 Holliday junction DNA helicase RuvA [Flavihumibacter petaseus NBRC 106054]